MGVCGLYGGCQGGANTKTLLPQISRKMNAQPIIFFCFFESLGTQLSSGEVVLEKYCLKKILPLGVLFIFFEGGA